MVSDDKKRFSADEWQQQPAFFILSQHYLLINKHVAQLLEQLVFSDMQERKRVYFFVTQYLDALSPENYLCSNPELWAQTVQSQGKNILRGLRHFLNDIKADPAHFVIPMT